MEELEKITTSVEYQGYYYKNTDIGVAVHTKNNERNAKLGDVKTNKQTAVREIQYKENPVLFAFRSTCRTDRHRGIE